MDALLRHEEQEDRLISINKNIIAENMSQENVVFVSICKATTDLEGVVHNDEQKC